MRCRDLKLGGLPDEDWIPQVSGRDLVIVTADVRTRYRPAEKQAIVAAKARPDPFLLLLVREGDLTKSTFIDRQLNM